MNIPSLLCFISWFSTVFSLSCGHKIILRNNIFYWRTYFIGLHVFQDNIYYNMSWGRLCFVVGNVLWDVMYQWSACLQDSISYNMLCFTKKYPVLMEVMFYLKLCIIKGYVLLFEMSYCGTCFRGGCILQDDLLYMCMHYYAVH